MKKIIIGIFLTAFATSLSHAQQADDNVGIGFMVGEPTGLSLKSWIGENHAFDVGLAWSLDSDAVHIHADYLWHNFGLFNDVNSGSLPLYYGVGGRIVFDDDDDAMIGARVPVGLNYLFEDAPIGLFLELAPIFNLAPDTDFDLEGALGVRYYL